MQHSNTPEDGCWVAESTVHKSATTIAGQPVPEGAWTVTVGIEDPEVIAKVDSGELNGLSIGGFAQYVLKVDMPPQDDPAQQGMFRKLFAWLGESLGLLKPSQDMQAAPFQKSDTDALTSAITEAVTTGFREAQKAARPSAAPPQTEPEPVGKSNTPQDDQKPIGKSDNGEPATIDTDTLMTCIKSAVQQELGPMKESVEAIAKSHNMPTNLKDSSTKLEKIQCWLRVFAQWYA